MSVPLSHFVPAYPSPSHLPSPTHLPQYPYILSLCLCLYFCFANKFICIIFLDSTYKWYYTIFIFFFWLTSLCMTASRSIHVSANCTLSFLFNDWVIFHCVHVWCGSFCYCFLKWPWNLILMFSIILKQLLEVFLGTRNVGVLNRNYICNRTKQKNSNTYLCKHCPQNFPWVNSFNPHNNLWDKPCHYPHFTDGKAKV